MNYSSVFFWEIWQFVDISKYLFLYFEDKTY